MDTPQRQTTTVLASRQLSEYGYELTLERNGMAFEAGRLITIHGPDITQDRSYTLAGGTGDPDLQVLYKYIPNGRLTSRLVQCKPGDTLDISGPFGQFTLRRPRAPLTFIATGTGVAPCRSYIRSHPDLDLRLIHGVRRAEDLYYREEFEVYDYHPCCSREDGTGFPARVTHVAETMPLRDDEDYYLCGAYEMIFDIHKILAARGISDDRVFHEEYYYRFDA